MRGLARGRGSGGWIGRSAVTCRSRRITRTQCIAMADDVWSGCACHGVQRLAEDDTPLQTSESRCHCTLWGCAVESRRVTPLCACPPSPSLSCLAIPAMQR